ncbi:hypothetical protein CR513_13721, partial [Mucuna pruriens]
MYVLRRFNMTGCNSVTTPIEMNVQLEKSSEEAIVGSLRYLCNNRLDICYGVGVRHVFHGRSKHIETCVSFSKSPGE